MSVFIHSFRFLMESELSKEFLCVCYGQQTSSTFLTRPKPFLSLKCFFFNLTWSAFDSLQYFHWSFIFLSFLNIQVFSFLVTFSHGLIQICPSKVSKMLMTFVTRNLLKTIKQCHAFVIVFLSSLSRQIERLEDLRMGKMCSSWDTEGLLALMTRYKE